MAMSCNGYTRLIEECAELIEECAELIQELIKKQAYWDTGEHSDDKGCLTNWIENEIGDVLAAIKFVVARNSLDIDRIEKRSGSKLSTYWEWEKSNPPVEAVADELKEAPCQSSVSSS